MTVLTPTEEGVKVFTLPEEPKSTDYFDSLEVSTGPQRSALQIDLNIYKQALAQAKSSAILVKDQEMAKIYIKGFLVKSGQNVLIENGKDYPIPGLKYTVEEACGHDCCPVDAGCEHCQKPVKLAILSLEETSEEMDDKFRQASKKFIDSAPSKEFKVTPVSDGETQEEQIKIFKEFWQECCFEDGIDGMDLAKAIKLFTIQRKEKQ